MNSELRVSKNSLSKCTSGKIRYRDKVAALIALSKIEYRSKRRNAKVRLKQERTIYRCDRCSGFHLSSL